jgi:hypothetical protein
MSLSRPGHRPHKSCAVVLGFLNICRLIPQFWLDDWQTRSFNEATSRMVGASRKLSRDGVV